MPHLRRVGFPSNPTLACATRCFATFLLAMILAGMTGCAGAAMISLAQGGIAAAQYAGIKAGEKSQDRGVPGPFEEQDSRCDSLETWSPKVEEVRLKNGAIETRQWRIVDQ